MSKGKCPCGARTTPDATCDMCDGWQNDPDTGWGGFTDHFLGEHFYSEEEREEYLNNLQEDTDE